MRIFLATKCRMNHKFVLVSKQSARVKCKWREHKLEAYEEAEIYCIAYLVARNLGLK